MLEVLHRIIAPADAPPLSGKQALELGRRLIEYGAIAVALEAIERPERLVHQCGSGVSASVNLLAMEIAGLRGSRLYPGSWSEWIADPSRPVSPPA